MSRCGSCPLYWDSKGEYKEKCAGDEDAIICADHLQSVIYGLESSVKDLTEKLSMAAVVFGGTTPFEEQTLTPDRPEGYSIDLPCKVGDVVYLKNVNHYAVIESYRMNKCTSFEDLYFNCRCVAHDRTKRKGERVINVCPGCKYGEKCFQGFWLTDFGESVFRDQK